MGYHQISEVAKAAQRSWQHPAIISARGVRTVRLRDFEVEIRGRESEKHTRELLSMIRQVPQAREELRDMEVKLQAANRRNAQLSDAIRPLAEGRSFDPKVRQRLKRLVNQ